VTLRHGHVRNPGSLDSARTQLQPRSDHALCARSTPRRRPPAAYAPSVSALALVDEYHKAHFADGNLSRRDRRPAALPAQPARARSSLVRDQRIVLSGQAQKNAASPYSPGQPGEHESLEKNHSKASESDSLPRRSSLCLRQLFNIT